MEARADINDVIEYKLEKGKNRITVNLASIPKNMVAICLPAMGVRASYYQPFANALAETGIHAVTVDWRGHGLSSLRASRKVNFGYKELIQDLDETVELLSKKFPACKKIIIGHSLGGQIGSLYMARYPGRIGSLVLIASCSVYHKGWQGFARTRVQLAGLIFYPLSRLVGYFPGKVIGFGGRESRYVMKDWSHTIKTGRYELENASFDYEKALSNLNTSILAFSIQGDDLAPRLAVDNLIAKFNPSSSVQHHHLGAKDVGVRKLTHFNWARHPVFVEQISSWMEMLENK